MDRKAFIRNIGLLGFLMPENPARSLEYMARTSPTPTEKHIINAGVSGNNTRNLLARLAKDCLAHRPSLVILMAGTNDVNSRNHVPLVEYEANLLQLTKRITASGSKLVLLSILPFHEPYLLTRHPKEFYLPEGPTGRRRAANAVIRKIAGQQNVSFFDMSALFEQVGKVGTDRDSLIKNEINSGKTDGIHPTPNGYRFMGLALSQFITCHKLPTQRIVCFGDSITRGDGSIDKESYPAYLKKLL